MSRALTGVLAVAAAVGAGQLVAGLVAPSSAPFLAVGDAVIDLSPHWLTEFAVSTFGTADKTVLLGGMAVVLALAGALAGWLSAESARPGTTVLVVLGLVGGAAVLATPEFAPLSLLAPAAALGAAVAVFTRLRATEGTDRHRRALLVVGAASLGGGVAGQLLSGGSDRAQLSARLAAVPREPAAPVPAAAQLPELQSFVTPNRSFYRIDVALRVPQPTAAGWRVRLHGMVERELVLTVDELLARPLVERTLTLCCVSNPVGGDLTSTATFLGVALRDLLEDAGVAPGADQLLTTGSDGWYTTTPLAALGQDGALLAVGMNGEALPPEHGYPVRMVVPGLYGYVSATKWLTDIEVTTGQPSYWSERGWAALGPIKTQSRIDVPGPYGSVPAGTVTVAGIAWAQPRGVAMVEVRLDGGAWQVAEQAADVSGNTWRMWRTAFDIAPGEHVVQCRATDRAGSVQTEVPAEPVPDGATGWHAVTFTVQG